MKEIIDFFEPIYVGGNLSDHRKSPVDYVFDETYWFIFTSEINKPGKKDKNKIVTVKWYMNAIARWTLKNKFLITFKLGL